MPTRHPTIEDVADLHKQIAALKNERAVFLDTIAQAIGTLQEFKAYLPLCEKKGCFEQAERMTANNNFRCTMHSKDLATEKVHSSSVVLETLRILKGVSDAK